MLPTWPGGTGLDLMPLTESAWVLQERVRVWSYLTLCDLYFILFDLIFIVIFFFHYLMFSYFLVCSFIIIHISVVEYIIYVEFILFYFSFILLFYYFR